MKERADHLDVPNDVTTTVHGLASLPYLRPEIASGLLRLADSNQLEPEEYAEVLRIVNFQARQTTKPKACIALIRENVVKLFGLERRISFLKRSLEGVRIGIEARVAIIVVAGETIVRTIRSLNIDYEP